MAAYVYYEYLFLSDKCFFKTKKEILKKYIFFELVGSLNKTNKSKKMK